MLTTHQDHVCKKCKEKPKTFMKLLKHMAKHYSIESKEEQDVSAANALKVEKNKCKKEKDLEKTQAMSTLFSSAYLQRLRDKMNPPNHPPESLLPTPSTRGCQYQLDRRRAH